MWSISVVGAVIVGAVLYVLGPIAALTLTAVGSAILLITTRSGAKSTQRAVKTNRPLEMLEGGGAEVFFPPLTQRAS